MARSASLQQGPTAHILRHIVLDVRGFTLYRRAFIQTKPNFEGPTDETYLSAKPFEARSPSRLPLTHVRQERPRRARTPPRQGPQAPVCIMSGAGAPPMTDPQSSDKTVVRLTRRPQFLFVRSGQSERMKSMVVQARRRKEGTHIGEGFTATRKIGNAVARNRAKRRLRAAAATLLPRFGLAGVDYVFIARQQTGQIGWSRLLDDMEKALISLASTLREPAG